MNFVHKTVILIEQMEYVYKSVQLLQSGTNEENTEFKINSQAACCVPWQ